MMKKGLYIIAFVVSLVASAQVRSSADTVQSNETIYLPTSGYISTLGNYRTLSLDFDCTEIGGTSDGTIILQARNSSDSEWSTITSVDFGNWINFLSNDTLTIVDGSVWKVELHDPGFNQYRAEIAGTANDTTYVELWYEFKK